MAKTIKKKKITTGKKDGRPKTTTEEKLKKINYDLRMIENLAHYGLTDKELADHLGVSVRTIDRWCAEDSVFKEAMTTEERYIKYSKPRNKYKAYDKNYAKAYYKRNKEKIILRTTRRIYQQNNLVSDLTVEQWNEALNFFGNECAYCGDGGRLEKEHIIPVSMGGGFTKKNIIPSCPACNQSKLNRPLDKWYKYSFHYTEQRLSKIVEWIYNEQIN